MIASTFKNYTRASRNMVVEENYNLGMSYTANTLPESNVRVLTNFNFKDDGALLTPRGGLQSLGSLPLGEGYQKAPMLTMSSVNVELLNNAYLKDYRTTVFMTAPAPVITDVPEYSKDKNISVFKVTEIDVAIKDVATNNFIKSTLAADNDTLYLIGFQNSIGSEMHEFDASGVKDYTPVNVTISNKPYFVTREVASPSLIYLTSLEITQDGDTFTHTFKKVEPIELSPKEVVNSGYNMLLDAPYNFENRKVTAYDILGILPYEPEEDGELLLSARQGQKIRFRVYYDYKEESNVTLMAKWEWIDPNSAAIEWTPLQLEKTNSAYPGTPVSKAYTLGEDIYLDFEPTVTQFQLRVSLYRRVGSTVDGNATKVMVMPLYKLTDSSTTSTTKNLEPINYNLATATGMTSWKQRVVLWGVTGGENILFTSDVNNPTYFPYPNNIDIFDENIINVVEYQTGLLVFTTTKVYLATLLEDGIGFSTTLVQNRLPLALADIKTVQVIKTLVFFKSENYYYMIVPKVTSLTGELTLAPVSKPITNLLDNFEEGLKEILETMYHMYYNKVDEYTLKLHNFYNYVDGGSIRNVYTFDVVDEITTRRFAFTLNYDSLLRVWSTYFTQVNGVMIPLEQAVTDNTILLDVVYSGTENTAQFLKYDIHNVQDTALLNYGSVREFKNYQYLDTGYRNHDDQNKKRFREMQLKFNNTSDKLLEFYSEFIIDDQRRQTFYDYVAQHITDTTSPNYGLIYMERVDDPTFQVPGQTILGSWLLDSSKFPPAAVVKVRFPVSGKGYAPRLKLLSYNEELYELVTVNWVSRALYAR